MKILAMGVVKGAYLRDMMHRKPPNHQQPQPREPGLPGRAEWR